MEDIRYSICATHYNNAGYLQDSVGVFADLIKGRDDFELVITDAGSDDGSLEHLQQLAKEQENVRIVVEEGINIGEGRRLASSVARGNILIQVMDLDADYYRDNRIIQILEFYEDLIQREGDVMLNTSVIFCTKELLNELGGWRPFPTNEETELRRRALRAGKLRFCPIEVLGENAGNRKGLVSATKRFYLNTRGKFQAGVGFWYALNYWLRHAPGLKPKLGAVVVFPVAWIAAKRSNITICDSYSKKDNFILGFRKATFEQHPEIWLDPPEPLVQYKNDGLIKHLQS